MTNSIYISVPSVEDKEIFNVAEQAFDQADNPDDIYMGICHSVPFNNKKIIDKINKKISSKNISQKFINFYRNLGVGYGRLGAISMYSGQDYVLQIDGHTNFSKSWDSIVLDLYHSVPKEMAGDKCLLTAYLPGYQIMENNFRNFPDNHIPRYSCFSSKKNVGTGQGLELESVQRNFMYPNIPRWITLRSIPETFNAESKQPPEILDSLNVKNFLPEGYVYSRKINANFMFCNKIIIDDYKNMYSWPYLFFEEEIIASIEAYAAGYSFIFPNFPLPLDHLYVDWYNEFYDENCRKTPEADNVRLKECQVKIANYLLDPKNTEKIKKYCEYAGLNYPELQSIDTFYIPGGNYAN